MSTLKINSVTEITQVYSEGPPLQASDTKDLKEVDQFDSLTKEVDQVDPLTKEVDQVDSLTNSFDSEEGYTKGEKCLCFHMAVILGLFILLIVLYLCHMFMVNHGSTIKVASRDSLRINNGAVGKSASKRTYDSRVGVLFLALDSKRQLCNTLLLNSRWSVTPAHCAAMRSDPDLSHLLQKWRVRYQKEESSVDAEIQKSIPHPRFTHGNFQNNIGLVQHSEVAANIPLISFNYLYKFNENDDVTSSDKFTIIGWIPGSFEDDDDSIVMEDVIAIKRSKCQQIASAVVDLRDYEFCVTSPSTFDIFLDHGAIFEVNGTKLGMFAWGDKSGAGLPLIIIDLSHFRSWLENMIDI